MDVSTEKVSLPQDPVPWRGINAVDKEIVETLISTQAVNFEAIGKTIASVGSKAVFVDDGWIRWCGSDLRIYRWPGPRLDLERLSTIRDMINGISVGPNR